MVLALARVRLRIFMVRGRSTTARVGASRVRPVATPAAQLATPLALAAAPPGGDAQRGSSAKAFNRSEVARAIRANFDSLVRASPLPRVRPSRTPALLPLRHVCELVVHVHL